jgi:hypothetical protein
MQGRCGGSWGREEKERERERERRRDRENVRKPGPASLHRLFTRR